MKRIYLILVLIIAASLKSAAQVMYYNNSSQDAEKVRIENVDVKQRNDTVNLSFDVKVDRKAVKSGTALYLIPAVKSSRGEMSLPAILVNGKKRSKFYKREQTLQGNNSVMDIVPAITVTVDSKRPQTARYNYSFLMTPDLDGADLVVDRFVEDCCKIVPEGSEKLLAGSMRATVVPVEQPRVVEQPKAIEQQVIVRPATDLRQSVVFLEPEKEAVKEREMVFTANIGYPVNIFEVRPYFENNMSELNRIDRLVAPLNNGEIYKLKSIRIEGFASPEGNWYHNEFLARNRANGFWSYLRGRYSSISAIRNVGIMAYGEDWNGLVKMINEEFMPYNKYEVLNLIERYGVFEGREAKLMMYAGGGPYRYMLHNFYPKLRRMEITIEYDVKDFDDREAASIAQQRPNDLSQYEMIRLARSQGSDILATYDLAVLYFPEDPVALINASSAELIRGNVDKAWTYLSKVINDSRAYNNIGVYYMMKGDTETARIYFKAAAQSDPNKANYNLRLLDGGAQSNNAPMVVTEIYDQQQTAAPVSQSPMLQSQPVQQSSVYYNQPTQQYSVVQPAATTPVYVPQSGQTQPMTQSQTQSSQPTYYTQPVQQQSTQQTASPMVQQSYYQQQPTQQQGQPVYQQQGQPVQQQQQTSPVATEVYRYK